MNTAELVSASRQLSEIIPLRNPLLAFFYSDEQPPEALVPVGESNCVVGLARRARQGRPAAFSRERFGCRGGGYYLGFCPPWPGLEQFVSTGIPGEMAGEHYKQSPELVRAYMAHTTSPPAPGPYAVFKPLAMLAEDEQPLVIIYLGIADELSGLVGLANFARAEDAVIAPFGSGCSSIVTKPLLEAQTPQPRAVLGMFDPSARPFVAREELSFAAPRSLWEEMVRGVGESFLQTETWSQVARRLRS